MKRILIRAPNWIGDQIMAYPFYRLLREAYPDAWIAVVSTEWVRDIQYKGLVDEVFVISKKKKDHFWNAFKALRQFGRRLKSSGPWDLGIALPNSFGATLLLWLAGVKERRGYEGIPHFDIRDYWQKAAEKTFDPIRYWPDIVPIEPPRDPYFLVAPGATADSRRWSVDQFSDLIEKIHEVHGLKAIIIGGNAEREIANQFLKRGLPIEDFTGKGWVSAHWKLFRQAQFTVCNESGLAHVAAMCGSPVHIVCGAADPKRTRPLGPAKVQVSINPIDCWPCERNVCRFEGDRKNACLKGIHPDRVKEEIELGFFTKS
jgi:heptosyltransferase-2